MIKNRKKFRSASKFRIPSNCWFGGSCLVILAFFFSGQCYAQKNLDSLSLVISQMPDDSLKAVKLNDLAWDYKFQNLDKSEKICHKTIALCSQINQIKLRSSAYNTLGLVKGEKNELMESIRYLELSIKDKETVNDKKGLATVKNNMGVAYKNLGNSAEAERYYREALAQHIELGNNKGQAETLNNLGVMLRSNGYLTKSDEYFGQSLEIRKKINDKNGIAVAYNNLCANATDRSEYEVALNYLYQAATLFEELNNKTALVAVYGNVAKLNKELLNYPTSLEYCQKAIDLGIATGAKQNLTGVYASKGDVLFAQKKYLKAKEAYSEGLRTSKGNENDFYSSHLHLGKGMCLLEIKKFELAEREIKRAVSLARKNKQPKPLARALQKQAKLNLETGQIDQVKRVLDEAVKICEELKYPDILQLCFQTYSNFYKAQENGALSSDYLIRSAQLKDSIFSGDLSRNFAEQQTKFETVQKENQIQLLEKDAKIKDYELRQRELMIQIRNYLILAGIIFLMLGLLSVYFIFQRYKIMAQHKRLIAIKETEELERTRIARDIHDDLGSGLSRIRFLTEDLQKPLIHSDDDQFTRKIHSINQTAHQLVDNMRDMIWTLNPENNTYENLLIRIREYVSDYLEDTSIDVKFEFEGDFTNLKISSTISRNLFLVAKEAVTNVLKHAEATSILCKANRSNAEFMLIIQDNGKGIDDQSTNGNGLRNMANRIQAIGGKFEVLRKDGTQISIQMNLDSAI